MDEGKKIHINIMQNENKETRTKMKLKETWACDKSLLNVGTEQHNLQARLGRWCAGYVQYML